MELKPGSRWKSVACNSEVVVIRPPNSAVTLQCGGHPMVATGDASGPAELVPAHSGGTVAGKRYFDTETGVEVLAAKAGQGSISVDGRPLPVKEAKALPSSD